MSFVYFDTDDLLVGQKSGNIPVRKDFVQDADKIKELDIERVKLNMSKICPRYVHERIKLIGNMPLDTLLYIHNPKFTAKLH